MKITFRGWKREVHKHIHEVIPVKSINNTYTPSKPNTPIEWESATKAICQIKKLSLSGDFLVEIEFMPDELKNWLKQYVAHEPETAARILAEMQVEAMINIAKKAKNEIPA